MFSAAIFDMDGLLINSERTIMNTWMTVGLELGLDIRPADYIKIVGRSSSECHAMLTAMLGGELVFQEALTRVRQRLETPAIQPVFPLKPGVYALLTALAEAGIPCAVASSSTRHEIKSRLVQVGVFDLFGTVVGGDEVALGKPNPAVYALAASRLGKLSSDCLAFEDSENGVLAANRAGIQVVTVPDLKQPTAEVIGLSFRVLETLDQAIDHVSAWFGLEEPHLT